MLTLPPLLSVLGALGCVAIERLVDNGMSTGLPEDATNAIASGIAAALVTLSLTLKTGYGLRSAAFSMFMGSVVGALVYGQMSFDHITENRVFALIVAFGIALPLYQASATPSSERYRALHRHAWSNLLVGALSTVFVGLAFASAWLLAELFALIEIDQIKALLRDDTVSAALVGAAAGGAAGVLRSNRQVVASTQGVLQSVLSLLAVPLGIGLPLFLAALIATGLTPLLDSNWSATATVLSAAALAVLLANSILGDTDSNMSANRLYRIAARLLCLCVLPLSAIALYALSLRIAAHGLSPERIWAGIAISIAVLYGVLYLVALIPGTQWTNRLRGSNTVSAAAVCALGLYLASPLTDIGAVAAKQQIARFESGEVPLTTFDAAAIAHDFGPGGRAVLEAYDASDNAALEEHITTALQRNGKTALRQKNLIAKLVIHPQGAELSTDLMSELARTNVCGGSYCHAFLTETHAIVLHNWCYNASPVACLPQTVAYFHSEGRLRRFRGPSDNAVRNQLETLESLAKRGDISLREVSRLRVHIGDTPVGQDIDLAPFTSLIEPAPANPTASE